MFKCSVDTNDLEREIWALRPYQVIFLFLIQLLSGNKCGRAQSKHTQAKKHWVISVKNDHVMPGKKADPDPRRN